MTEGGGGGGQVLEGACYNEEWLKNAVQLSGFFLAQDRILDAAHCLAAAGALPPPTPPTALASPLRVTSAL